MQGLAVVGPITASKYCTARKGNLPQVNQWSRAIRGPTNWRFPGGAAAERAFVGSEALLSKFPDRQVSEAGIEYLTNPREILHELVASAPCEYRPGVPGMVEVMTGTDLGMAVSVQLTGPITGAFRCVYSK